MEDQDPPTNDGLSDQQDIVRVVIRICSASLSVTGSSIIIFKILRDRAQNNGSMMPYDRIMIGLSCCDILASTTWAINQFLLPSDSGRPWAFGNSATCQASGFITQLSFSAWWYTCILSTYFLLTVLSQVRRKDFVGSCEPWMHLSAIFFPITAIMGLRRGWYGHETRNCWITDTTLKLIVSGIPTSITMIALIVNNIVIYAIVRNLTSVQSTLRKEATILMFLYVACFFITITPTMIQQILYIYFGYTNDNRGKLYPVEVLEAMFVPLQGFFNFFIYIKPTYTRFRLTNPNKSMFFVLHQALFNPNVPQSTFSAGQTTSDNNADLDAAAANPNRALFKSDFGPSDASSSSDLSFGIE